MATAPGIAVPPDAELAQWLACHDCDALHRERPLAPGQQARCRRCDAVLYAARRDPVRRTLALSLSGLLLFGPANLFPLLALSLEGRVQEMTIVGGARALWAQGLESLAIFVFAVSVAAPFLRLLGLFVISATLWLGRAPRAMAGLTRLVARLAPWGMLEVYLLGVIVAYVKLADLAQVLLGPAFVCFLGLIAVETLASTSFDARVVWQRLGVAR